MRFNRLVGIVAVALLCGTAAAQDGTPSSGSTGGNWRLVGPTDAEPMEEVEGGDVGGINAFAFHPSQPHPIFAATPVGGLWRTQDDGAKWELLTNLPNTGSQDIAIDPLAPDTIYLLTGDGEASHTVHFSYGLSPPSIGILKSQDGGRTWAPTGLSLDSSTGDKPVYGFRLAINPSNPAILLAAMSVGIYRTSDGGNNWQNVIGDEIVDVVFHPTDPNIVYAASAVMVFRSQDAGQTWESLDPGFVPTSNRIRLAVTRASPDSLYVLFGADDGFSIGLYRSDDRGDHFVKRSSTDPLSNDTTAPPINLTKTNIFGRRDNDFDSQSYYDIGMAVSPNNADELLVGGIDVWRSKDGGRTWDRISKWDAAFSEPARYVHADIHMVAYRDGAVYAASDGGIYRASDAGNAASPWASITRMKTGITLAQIYYICSSPARPDVLYYGAQDNGTYRLDISGKIRQVGGGDGFVCQVDPRNPDTLYINANQSIHRTDKAAEADIKHGECTQPDGSEDWCDYKDVTPTSGTTELAGTAFGAWVTPYILGADPEGANGTSLYSCYADLWKSKDRGEHWTNLSSGALGRSTECRQVAVSPADPRTIYVGKIGKAGVTPFFGGGGVFRSTDGGTTWRPVTADLPFEAVLLTDLAVSPTDARQVWATFQGYHKGLKVFTTADGGATWTNVSAGLPNNGAHVIAAANGAHNPVYAGMDDGVYYRDDTMANWAPFKQGLPIDNNGLPIVVTSLLIQEAQHRLFAATFGRGVWVSELHAP